MVDTIDPSLQSLNPFAGPITRIHVNGKGGDDTIVVADTISIAVTALGGSGDDTIRTGRGNDRLDGGSGNDELFAGGGSDVLIGGAGTDILRGEAGDDELWGGYWGNPDDGRRDRLIGGSGRDVFFQVDTTWIPSGNDPVRDEIVDFNYWRGDQIVYYPGAHFASQTDEEKSNSTKSKAAEKLKWEMIKS